MMVITCTAQRAGGAFCDGPAAPYMPFPICAKHAIRVYNRMREFIEANEGVTYANLESFTQKQADDRDRADKANRRKTFIVYYLDVFGTIKIGVTGNLKQRLAAYPPGTEVLATELGDHRLEGQRHFQFRHLLKHGNEWFRPGPDLLAHIEGLKRQAA